MTRTQIRENSKRRKAQVVEDTVTVLTTNINVTNEDKRILSSYVDEWLDGVCLEPNIRSNIDFYASCFTR